MDYRGATATTVEIRLLNRKSPDLSEASAFENGFLLSNNCELLLSTACDYGAAETIVDAEQHLVEVAPAIHTLSLQIFG